MNFELGISCKLAPVGKKEPKKYNTKKKNCNGK